MGLLDDLDGSMEEENPLADKKDIVIETMIKNITDEHTKFNEWAKVEVKKYYAGNSLFRAGIGRKFDFSITHEMIQYYLENYEKYMYNFTWFGTALIQNAYDQGHNDFGLPVFQKKSGIPHAMFGWYLYGEKENPINLTIEDERAYYYCSHCSYSKIKFLKDTITSNAQECYRSEIVFLGNTGQECAVKLDQCKVYCYGEIGDFFGEESKKTEFHSPHIENLDQISKGKNLRNCSFYLVDENDEPHEVIYL